MRCLFVFKQKTAYEVRISDWSSDVCSSDLAGGADHEDVLGHHFVAQLVVELGAAPAVAQRDRDRALGLLARKSGVSRKSVSVRVDAGGRRYLTKKITHTSQSTHRYIQPSDYVQKHIVHQTINYERRR